MSDLKTASAGPYNLSIVPSQIMESIGRIQSDDVPEAEIRADLDNLDLDALMEHLPYKVKGGLMQNRKPMLKKYRDTVYDPGYHERKVRCWCLRIVPIDNWNAVISLDDVTIDLSSLDEQDILG